MKTIILCGGTGYRLREETEFKPKPMVLVGNKPIIWHIMKIYAQYGFNEFILALGYKADYIKDFFLNQKAFTSDFTLNTSTHEATYYLNNRDKVDNFTITFVDTGLDTEVGERILKCKKYIPEKDRLFMLTYGDGVSDIDLGKLVAFHKQQKTKGTITGIHPQSRFGMMVVGDHSLVNQFSEKPVQNDWVNGGFMVFERQFFDYLRKGETEHPALQRLAKERQLALYPHEGFWYAVDTYKELETLNKLWADENPPWKVWQ
ncbi:glucose-1-phosphate cytidylyltransferase [Candidatus Gottesmanbacteria bacterium]|nr:glucose-1-phosphate cytidylyltransferase [Candidatus Gottesmanbacteria bacterium]